MSWAQHQLNTRHANINLSCGFRFRFLSHFCMLVEEVVNFLNTALEPQQNHIWDRAHGRGGSLVSRLICAKLKLVTNCFFFLNKPLIISYGQCIRVSVTLNKHRNPLGISTFLGLVELQFLLVVPSQSRFVLSVSLHTKFAPKALHVVCRETWHNV